MESLFHVKLAAAEIIVIFVIPVCMFYILIRLLFIKKCKIKLRSEVFRLGIISYTICIICIVWVKPVPILNYLPFNIIPFKTLSSYIIEFWSGRLVIL